MPLKSLASLFVTITVSAFAFAGCGSSGHRATRSNCATSAGAQKATDTGSVRATSRVIDIDAREFAFSPTCVLDMPSGTDTLVVHNTGSLLHDVQIGAQHIDRDVQPGATVQINVDVGSDPIVFVCKYHEGLGMAGALVPASSGTSP